MFQSLKAARMASVDFKSCFDVVGLVEFGERHT